MLRLRRRVQKSASTALHLLHWKHVSVAEGAERTGIKYVRGNLLSGLSTVKCVFSS